MAEIDTQQEFKESKCQQCGNTFNAPVYRFLEREFCPSRLCAECGAKQDEEIRLKEEQARAAKKLLEWNKAVPESYRESDLQRLNPRVIEIVKRFEFQDSKGIYLYGDFRKGKTRCACLILRKAHDRGRSVMMIRAIDFAKYCANQFADNSDIKRDAIRKLDRCNSADVLLLDDLGKEKITERVETTLFDVIDDRISRAKPMLITSNFDLISLGKRMSSDQAPAIISRIMEFCHIVELK